MSLVVAAAVAVAGMDAQGSAGVLNLRLKVSLALLYVFVRNCVNGLTERCGMLVS